MKIYGPKRFYLCKYWHANEFAQFTQEPLYNGHYWGQQFVRYSAVSLTQGLLVYIRYAWHCVIRLSSMYYVAAFSEISFAVRWQGRLSRG